MNNHHRGFTWSWEWYQTNRVFVPRNKPVTNGCHELNCKRWVYIDSAIIKRILYQFTWVVFFIYNGRLVNNCKSTNLIIILNLKYMKDTQLQIYSNIQRNVFDRMPFVKTWR